MKTSSRLFDAMAFLALSAGLALPAAADTTANVDLDNNNAPATIFTSLSASATTAAPTIADLQEILGAGIGITTVDNSNVINFAVVGNNATENLSGTDIFTRTRGNDADNPLGVSGIDGAIILQGQQTVPNGANVTALAATTNDNLILNLLFGTGQNVTASVTDSVVEAVVSFNTSFSTIETTIPANLADGTQGSYHTDLTIGGADTANFFPTDVDQTANYNVTTVQVNFGFANGNAASLTTASVTETTILLARSFPPLAGQVVSGNFGVDSNAVRSATLGNASDNSIFLHSGDASAFGGTAFVSATQSSNDFTPAAGQFPAISASTEDTNIVAAFATVFVGPPLFLSADGLVASVDGNTVTSSAIINSARNELAFDGNLALAGGDSTTLFDTGFGDAPAGAANLDVTADFGVVSNQTAANGAALQRSQSVTEDTLIALLIEDVDGDSTLSFSGNAVAASAGGQDATNIIRNNNNIGDPDDLVAEGSVAIVGSFAVGNRQYMVNEAITALVTENQLSVEVGTEDDGSDPFGGLVGSTLTVRGNAFNASASGNAATAQVDLSGLSIDITGDQTGAVINSENFGTATTPRSAQNSDGGVNIANWQSIEAAVSGANFLVGAEVANSDILVLVNFDQGSVGNEESPEVADAVISVDGNAVIASAALNSYDATANVAAATSLTGSVAALSHQSTHPAPNTPHAVDATVFDSEVSTLIGVNDAASDVAVTTDGNDVLALANGNESVQAIAATAGTSLSADANDNGGGANAIFTDISTAADEAIRTDIEAYAAYLAVSDQALRATQVDSRVEDFEVNLVLASSDSDADPATLSDSRLSLSGNDLIAQTLGNSATNNVALDAGTTIFGHVGIPNVGPTAGIVSSQTAVQEAARADSAYEGEVLGNTINASILETGDSLGIDDTTLAVDGNRIQALTFANNVGNDITLSGNSFVVDSLQTARAAVDPGTFDLTMFVDGSAAYILNRQRNEGLDETVAGPTAESFASQNSVLANVDGGVNGVDSGTASLSGNAIQATAAGTGASNTITLEFQTTAATGAAILNRQGNSGNINGDNEDSLIEANALGDDGAIHDNLTVNVDANAITSSATGNSASNLVQAAAGELVGVGNNAAGSPLSGAYIGPSPLPSTTLIGYVRTDGATLDANANAVANGNLVVLNTQRNFGIDNDGGESLINSETENAEILLGVDNADLATTNSTLALSANQVRSTANANFAVNTVSTTTSSGGPDLTTVLNDQGVQNTNVTSAATDTTVALNVDGDFDGGTIGVNGNQVIASGNLNSSTNTILAQSTVGDLPGATIINHQSSAGSSVSANNSGTTISTTTGAFGGVLSNSTVTLSGNQIGSSATINNVTNKISAPGQVFTRTSSF